jgi:hypothetical protein
VEATVLESEVDRVRAGSGDVSDQEYRPVVEFEYTYEGESYTSDERFPSSLDQSYGSRSKAESAIEEYEEGETVTAYVDPDSPGRGFLENKRSMTPYVAGLFGVVSVVAGGRGIRQGRGD